MTCPQFKVKSIDIDDYPESIRKEIADLDCCNNRNTVSIEITEPCTLIVNTSEWTQVYKLIKEKGAENDLPAT